ncbi:HNH endonuclease [Candidatus Solirubrobacter pratensis]|uniref:HNH endonuclease n=1 Tax=Candidatus Solirubrobacter pratensis TaxID=1298857 RepID=UPI0018CAD462|nr:HNH endonuclease [Candidatus Solirubrobacter pratensis]
MHGHNARLQTPPYWVDPNRGCWLWQRALSEGRYGIMHVPGEGLRMAHRVFYEEHVGPIPAGEEITWTCGNRSCINPAHLEAVSRRIVVRRGRATKLSAEDIRTVRVLWRDGMTDETLARHFGVSTTRIRQVTRGKDAGTTFEDC